MSKPIDDAAAISQAANNAWDSEHEEDRANFRLGFFAGVRWAEQQLAAQAPEPTPATLGQPVFRGQVAAQEPDLSWVKVVAHLEDGSAHLFDGDAWENTNQNQDIFFQMISRVDLHRTGKGE